VAEKAVKDSIENLRLNCPRAALLDIWTLVVGANQYIERTAPFKIAKVPEKALELDAILYSLVETCRVLAVLLWPFIPATSEKIYVQLGLKGNPDKFTEAAWGKLVAGHTISEPAPLFPRKDLLQK
jgi:methionyl-tRNA synthetase